jgi:hypothetical protein
MSLLATIYIVLGSKLCASCACTIVIVVIVQMEFDVEELKPSSAADAKSEGEAFTGMQMFLKVSFWYNDPVPQTHLRGQRTSTYHLMVLTPRPRRA